MAQMLWSQDVFTKGELSPLLYSRVTLDAYYNGLKRAKNVICYPQGCAGKRFGTFFFNQLSDELTNYRQIYFKAFQYLNECCYLLVWHNDSVDIILEGLVVATVTGTQILADEISLIDHTIIENKFRVTTGLYPPKDLRRRDDLVFPIPILGFTPTTLNIAAPGIVDTFFPARFTAATAANLPVTSPQIHFNKTYFIRFITANDIAIYSTAQDAAADINRYAITSAGVAPNVRILNIWSVDNVVFKNFPQFDFTGGYDTSTFNLAASSGYLKALTTLGPFQFTPQYVGGSFRGNGGIARIVQYVSPNAVIVDIVQSFASTDPIPGTQVLITENAWSEIRGWPRKCSSFQSRAFFANTDLLSNGIWGSVTNEINDFDDLDTADDDSAISWLPTSDTVNYIQFIVPYRSLTVHTNSGIYSTPLSSDTAITPSNFSLVLQDTTPAGVVQPQSIDNQIVVLSGNDAHSLLWDGFNNSYNTNIISVANEHLIRNPIDEAPFTDRIRAGSRYMFIVNGDGTLAIYQSLIGENVTGFTEAELEQSYGNAYFRAVTSNFDGRAWFLNERQIADANTFAALSPYAPIPPESGTEIFTAIGHGMPIGEVTAITFDTDGSLLISTPQVNTTTFYWANATDADTFKVYLSQIDAIEGNNAILANLIPVDNSIVPYLLKTVLMIEQLSFDSQMDCAGYYPTTSATGPTSSIDVNSTRFNAQRVLMQGDGFGFENTGINSSVDFVAHGQPVEINEAHYGFPINVEITPMPLSLSMSGNPKSSNLLDTKHLRFANFLFADTIGGTITQDGLTFPIAINRLQQNIPGNPPVPRTGNFEVSIFNAWDDFNRNNFTINHTEPFGMKLTGIFYKVDVV